MNRSQGSQKPEKEDLVFFIRVQYRCNSSWQGSIQWMDGCKSSVFRSVLELGNLINDAKKKVSGDTDEEKNNWEDKESAS